MAYKSGWIALCCSAVICAASVARAGSVDFQVQNFSVTSAMGDQIVQTFYPDQQGQISGARVASELNGVLGGFAQQLEQTVNQKLGSINFNGFLGAMSKASVSVNKTQPYDYASDASIFSLTVGAGAAVNNTSIGALTSGSVVNTISNDLSNETIPDIGASVSASVLLGINLRPFHLPKAGVFDPSKLMLYVDFATFKTTIQEVALGYTTFGLHAQYHILDGIGVAPGGILRWGGLVVGTGFDYSSFSAKFQTSLPSGSTTQSFDYVQDHPLTTNLAWSGNATLTGNVSIGSIPLEVMTSVQLLYALTLYAGGALDFNFGSASIDAEGLEPVNVSLSNSSTTLNIAKPDAKLTLTASGSPAVANVRAFGGLQVNLFVLAVFAQANVDSDKNLAVNLGARAFW